MRPQLNLSLDEYPELPEKLKKFCKVRRYRISDFCARVLNEAIDKELTQMAGNTPELTVSDVNSAVEELRARLGVLEKGLNNLNDGFNENVPNLINDTWLFKKAIFESAEPLIKLVDRVKQLEAQPGNNSQMQERLNKLSDELPRLVQDIWMLKEASRESGEPLSKRVERLEALLSEVKADMEYLKKTDFRSEGDLDTPTDAPKIECPHCGAVGFLHKGFKPAGSSKGFKRYQCSKCTKKIVQRPAPDIPQN